MPRYVKKPVVITANQFIGDNFQEVADWIGDSVVCASPDNIMITTLEGDHLALVGDFIIQGVKGEFYPCKPDIFHLTYDPVGE